MDGYTLIARMRKLRRRYRLTATEQALYQELIAINNDENWVEIFQIANNELFVALNITEKTLIKARENLIQCELIYYHSGKSKREVGSYSFIKPFETTVKIPVDNTGNSIDNGTVKSIGNSSDLIKTKTETEIKRDIPLKKGGNYEYDAEQRREEYERIFRQENGIGN